MTKNEFCVPGESILGEIECDPREANEIAAARAMNHSLVILHKALAESGLKQSDLAKILNVGESRVSQVLNGEGNIKVTSLARFLRSMGYEPEFTAKPVDPTKPVISAKATGIRNRRAKSSAVTTSDTVAKQIEAQNTLMNQVEALLKMGTSSLKVRPTTSYKHGFNENMEPTHYGTRSGTWTTSTR